MPTPLEKSDIKAFLGPGSQFEGKLAFTEIVRLDGLFRGEISSKDTLIVGQTGELQAEIKVGTLILSGKLKGNVTAAARVELRAPAEVEGNIATPLLTVEEGVIFNGSLEMVKNSPEPAKKG
ncbi:bactofilin family protein [Geoalkalibacter halelectricus]|uniref:Polymer-forming cytoskeletal protein n=1 Tax=Geoalkalibacter halelectricus TaxID=2847045 RepID=A0ABY5ZJE8_9BACT|nr:polymer-forming cytoskeletal protein [Geoalkalibacter halelectricus]MDO3378223.1 polymer-forming cytoskeletal protein [Geoalkalibacter halelectricus]UWZ78065.1 polymer-forming cytoskeletal protein [Geoalkalibacter halelectricus]